MDKTLQLILFMLLFIALFSAMTDSLVVIGEGVDLYGTFWFYWWVGDALEHGQGLFFTDRLFFPFGKDVFSHTGSNVLDALCSIPFQWIFGAPEYQPFFIFAVLQLNGVCFEQYARLWTSDRVKIASSTLMFSCMPYVCWELAGGRITQVMLFPSIIALLYFERLIREGGFKPAVVAGVMTAIQGWTYWFYGYFLGFFLIWRILVSHKVKERWAHLLCSFTTCACLVAPAVLMMYSKDKIGEVPGLGNGFINNVHPILAGYVLWEPGNVPFFSFISIASALILGLMGQDKKIWLGWLVLSLFIATGPTGVWGESTFQWPHYSLLQEIPFFSRLWFPYRILPFASLALFTGLLLSRIERKYIIGVTVVYFVEITLWGLYPFHTSRLDDGQVYQELHKEGALLELPLGIIRPSHYHQMYHGRSISGGMGENLQLLWSLEYRDEFRKRFSYFRKLSKTSSPAQLDRSLVADFEYLTVDKRAAMSILDKDGGKKSEQYLINLCLLFGPPLVFDENIVVWDLTTPEQVDVCEKGKWMEAADFKQSSWEELLRERGRIP